jgi:integrase/recombinase XerC
MQLDYLYKEFMQDRKIYCTNQTLDFYDYYIPRFLYWLGSNELSDLNKHKLKEYILSMRGTMKNTSIRTNYRPVKAFCRWLYQEEYIPSDITIGIKLPKADPAIIELLTDADVKQIDNTIINKSFNDLLALRNYCIFHLALDCGLRRKEIVNLMIDDCKENIIIVHEGKCNKDRIVLLPHFLYCNIQNYYKKSHVTNSTAYIFLDLHNNYRITINTIKDFYQDLKQLSGINRIHCHLCRHTFATSYLQYGGDIEKLRLFMGHTDYEILKNYLHLSIIYPNVYRLDDIFFQDKKI